MRSETMKQIPAQLEQLFIDVHNGMDVDETWDVFAMLNDSMQAVIEECLQLREQVDTLEGTVRRQDHEIMILQGQIPQQMPMFELFEEER